MDDRPVRRPARARAQVGWGWGRMISVSADAPPVRQPTGRGGRAHRNVSEYAAALGLLPERAVPGHCRPCTTNSAPAPARSPNAAHGCGVLCARGRRSPSHPHPRGGLMKHAAPACQQLLRQAPNERPVELVLMQQTRALASKRHLATARPGAHQSSRRAQDPDRSIGTGNGGDCGRTWLLRRLKTSQNGCPTMLGLSRPGPPQACQYEPSLLEASPSQRRRAIGAANSACALRQAASGNAKAPAPSQRQPGAV